MDYYFSGGGGGRGVWRPPNERILQHGMCRLVSNAFPGQVRDFLELKQSLGLGATVLLDSGAFTAWTKGEEVNREALARAFEEVCGTGGVVAHLINLDRIPGRKGVDPTPDEIRIAMEESEANFEWLSTRFPGRVLPVFHQGEPVAYLDRLAATSAYICLSPRNDLPERQRVDWAQRMHARLPTGVKTHGLATTGFTMMATIPWYSVDSAAWNMITAYGGVYIPWADKSALGIISVSAQSEAAREEGKHIQSLCASERKAFYRMVEDAGFDMDRLAVDQPYRAEWNVEMLRRWLPSLSVTPVHQPGLFD